VPRGLYVVVEGLVRVVRIVAGRQHVVHSEGPGGTLGDVPLFDGSTYPATAIAASAVTCAVFSREALQRALLARLAGRVRHVIERLDGAQARTVGQRLSRHLVGRFRTAGAAPFDLGGTQTAVAEELGTVREVLVRELRALRDAGAIAPVGRGRWRVVDEDRLRHRAGLRGREGAPRET
jgi:CRP/FNR family transcriptional regulator